MVGFNRRFALLVDLQQQLSRLQGPKAFVSPAMQVPFPLIIGPKTQPPEAAPSG